METKQQPIGETIRSIREKRKITKAQLARESDVDPTYLGQIEANERDNPGWLLVCRIADSLGVKVDKLRGK